MLDRLRFENFKSWEHVNLKCAPITGIFGTNSSGKTSLLQFVLMLKQTKDATDRRHLNPSGQPGVGDRFYQAVLMSAPTKVDRVVISQLPDGQYSALPPALRNSTFDQSDRKFAAISIQEQVPVAFCTDSDWVAHATLLAASGVTLTAVCGMNAQDWFE